MRTIPPPGYFTQSSASEGANINSSPSTLSRPRKPPISPPPVDGRNTSRTNRSLAAILRAIAEEMEQSERKHEYDIRRSNTEIEIKIKFKTGGGSIS